MWNVECCPFLFKLSSLPKPRCCTKFTAITAIDIVIYCNNHKSYVSMWDRPVNVSIRICWTHKIQSAIETVVNICMVLLWMNVITARFRDRSYMSSPRHCRCYHLQMSVTFKLNITQMIVAFVNHVNFMLHIDQMVPAIVE